jgi:type II restriction/modification system DNA methylase subunit YeeA
MNLGQLERYAPQARIDFIHAVTARASKLGISNSEVLEAKKSGDALIIGGNVFPVSIDHKRKVLADRVEKDGFDKVMEEAAYTWFNRFTAMRYMEIHGYIEEHPFSLFEGTDDSSEPEVLKNVADLNDWKELNFNLALDLKTQNKTEDLYRLILTAQCDSLGKIIPFLFSYHAAETELLLPDGLLLSDSIIKEMISVLNEDNLGEVESLGWLYQFYISEKKDTLMKAKKAYKTDEIPAVTQLFTPNWIVKYLTQNSIGRLWLSVYPSSPLKNKMEYYIEPAEQTDEVNKQLADITPDSLNPEEITVLDPACGSGHILVEAYNLLKEIYLERGYQEKEIPKLILKNNLFGLDIDDRAAQLARFVLLMRAREDDKRLFRSEEEIVLNVHAIQEITENLEDFKALGIDGVEELISTFENAKTFGSLIEISKGLKGKLEQISAKVLEATDSQTFDSSIAKQLVPLVNQAMVIGKKYDVVVANPPYLSGKGMNPVLKTFAKNKFQESKGDLFAMFIQHGFRFAKTHGFNAMVTMQSWMFLSSFESLRRLMLSKSTLSDLVQIGYNSFPSLNSKVAQATAFVCKNTIISDYTGTFLDLNTAPQSANKKDVFLRRDASIIYFLQQREFLKISGNPIAFWVSDRVREIFQEFLTLDKIAEPKQGLATGDNDRFMRYWYEVSDHKIGFGITSGEEAINSKKKWFPYNKGGEFRKWYGNMIFVVNWENDGYLIRNHFDNRGKLRSRPQNTQYYFRESITWTLLSSSNFGVRYMPEGALFDINGMSCFINNGLFCLLGFMSSKLCDHFLRIINPTLAFQVGDIRRLPILQFGEIENIESICKKAISLSRIDWDSFETSWDFKYFPLIKTDFKNGLLEESFKNWSNRCDFNIKEMQHLETENNRLFIEAYELQDELTPEVLEDQITLSRSDKTEEIKRLISYSTGCIMGRYSLDEQGLIYAHSNNERFNASKYKTFPADDDGIITLSDMEDLMIRDDIANRFEEFLIAVWGKETLSENLKFVADTLGSKTDELPKETIRRWISTDFFKDHLQRYKNRPIYWLFSSGKKKAFEALVYLHRYNESTLSKMRMKYVVPLQTRISDQLKTIDDDIESASAQERNRLTRKKKLLSEKEVELREYDETLRHLAEQQITLDLDDGVKVNYGKFPGLLAETKKVSGK